MRLFTGFFLTICISIGGSASQLNWCHLLDTSYQENEPLQGALKRVSEVAQSALTVDFKPVKSLFLEGTLPSEPKHKSSQEAVGRFPKLLDLAVCARTAAKPLSTQCQSKLTNVVLSWAETYQPTGNPIDENQFTAMFQAIDLISDYLPADDKKEIFGFIRKFADQGDRFFAAMKPGDKRLSNNWQTWRLEIRSLAASVTDDAKLFATSKSMFHDQLSTNIHSDGSTLDFKERDALHYHVYDLEAYETALQSVPNLFNSVDKARLHSGFDFLQPYYKDEKKHIEFTNSTVDFDKKRRQAGVPEFQNSPWKPENSRKLLRIARLNDAEIKTWTGAVVDEHYDPTVKLIAAACGERSTGAPPEPVTKPKVSAGR